MQPRESVYVGIGARAVSQPHNEGHSHREMRAQIPPEIGGIGLWLALGEFSELVLISSDIGPGIGLVEPWIKTTHRGLAIVVERF